MPKRALRAAPKLPPIPGASSEADTAEALIAAALRLTRQVDKLRFGPPVSHVYNPLHYAWAAHEAYLKAYARGKKRVVFLGMNPGPFGMVQTGIPFGEINAVRDWLQITNPILAPAVQHPSRPVLGLDCPRCEISGQRLWGLFAQEFGTAREFFRHHFVLNYCPLAFLEESGRNRTPDKLPVEERDALFAACNEHLQTALAVLRPEWVVGIGAFAYARAVEATAGSKLTCQLRQILHPSPASPVANRGWAAAALKQLREHGIIPSPR